MTIASLVVPRNVCSCRLPESLYFQGDYYLKSRLAFLARSESNLVDHDEQRAQKFDLNSLIITSLFLWETEKLGKMSNLAHSLQRGEKIKLEENNLIIQSYLALFFKDHLGPDKTYLPTIHPRRCHFC